MTLHYATVADLLNFKSSGHTIDFCEYTNEDLETNLAIAESIVESYVNTLFYEITQAVYFNGSGNQNIYLAQLLNYPIISASACTEVDENDEVLFTYTEDTDYVIRPWYLSKNWTRESGRLEIGQSGPTWPHGCRNIKVTGVYGYEEVPPEVKRATLVLAAEVSIPGSTGFASNHIAKQQWDDYVVTFKGQSQIQPSPSDSTGFEFVDRLLDKWRFKPDLFLLAETSFVKPPMYLASAGRSSSYPLN